MAAPRYGLNVFVNCPFDRGYRQLFRATIFTIYDCGFIPRSALEHDDSADNRLNKINSIIKSSKLGIHDISRTGSNSKTKLPRFNMPFELGIFLGARSFGNNNQRRKRCLILDKEPYRYLAFLSDIRGQDIKAHHNDVQKIIKHVRDWLNNNVPNSTMLPGEKRIYSRFSNFSNVLPRLIKEVWLTLDELQFNDFSQFVSVWIEENPK